MFCDGIPNIDSLGNKEEVRRDAKKWENTKDGNFRFAVERQAFAFKERVS